MTKISVSLNDVTAVLVTYGDRYRFLRQAIAGLKREGIESIVVVNNGAPYDVRSKANSDFDKSVVVVDCLENTGSATGFSKGIEFALTAPGKYIFLLDDDNVPQLNSLSKLATEYRRVLDNEKVSVDNLIVVGFREEHFPNLKKISNAPEIFPDNNSFFSFHLKDAWAKVGRRIPLLRRYFERQVICLNGMDGIRLFAAPYSGMLFHKELVSRHGKPKDELVLYADDVEFSYRITNSGGIVWLALNAPIDELEMSWGHSTKFKSSFSSLLKGEGDFRAYYSTRNLAWFEMHRREHNKIIRTANKYFYLFVLLALSVVWRRVDRALLLLSAIRDGEAEKLGVNSKFPLH